MIGVRAVLVLASALAAAALGGCAQDEDSFPRPLPEVHAVLASIDELPPVFGSNEPAVTLDSSDPARIDWILALEGEELMRIIAKLEPKQVNSTSVDLEIVAPSGGRFGNVDRRLKEHPRLVEFYHAAMREKIASRLEQRPFDMVRTYPALRAALAENVARPAARSELHEQ